MSVTYIDSPENVLAAMKECIDSLNADVFEGVIIIAKGNEIECHVRAGTVEQRLNIIDLIFNIMYKMRELPEHREVNEAAWNFFMSEMYKRFKFYFAETYKHELNDNV